LPEDIEIEEIMTLYSMYREDSDMMLQIVLFALNRYPSEIEEGLGITKQYRERLEQVAMKMFAPEIPETEHLN
tara:strand:+ start:220 stop:438 length:219 start_codon:yes stop_codon:yes gene_type:complete